MGLKKTFLWNFLMVLLETVLVLVLAILVVIFVPTNLVKFAAWLQGTPLP